jgi:hypothetical protein
VVRDVNAPGPIALGRLGAAIELSLASGVLDLFGKCCAWRMPMGTSSSSSLLPDSETGASSFDRFGALWLALLIEK